MKLGIVVSHPIPYFTPWYAAVAGLGGIDLKVFYCCSWGLEAYRDPGFGKVLKWDVPMLDGYESEMLPRPREPSRLSFWDLDNPSVGTALGRFDPDVVNVYGYARRTNWRVALWAGRRKVPVLLFSDSNAAARRSLVRRVAKRVVVRRFYAMVSGALYTGDNNLAYHKHYGLPDERLFEGVFPVDVSRLTGSVEGRERARKDLRAQLRIPSDAVVVMFCGKYLPWKRPMDLVRAIEILNQRGRRVWGLLVGEGAKRAELEDYVRGRGIENVTLTGFVNQSSIASYYAASDIMAVTSSEDAHPLVATEGIAFGLPLVISDSVGCVGKHDVARNEESAVVYPCGDVEALARAIQSLAEDPARYRHLSEGARRIASTQTPERAADLLAAAAQSLQRLGPR